MSFHSPAKKVACKPFPTHAVQAQTTTSGFVYAAPRQNLVGLEVLAEGFAGEVVVLPGDKVYVPLEFANSAWGKTRMQVAAIGEFILVPEEHVALVECIARPPRDQ